MTNNITIELTRYDLTNVTLAIIGVIYDMQKEYANETTTQDRKDVLNQSITMWQTLKNKIAEQSK